MAHVSRGFCDGSPLPPLPRVLMVPVTIRGTTCVDLRGLTSLDPPHL
jgi:hypothetical protein